MTKIAPKAQHPLVCTAISTDGALLPAVSTLCYLVGSTGHPRHEVAADHLHRSTSGTWCRTRTLSTIKELQNKGVNVPYFTRECLDPFHTEVANDLLQFIICKNSHKLSYIHLSWKCIVYTPSPVCCITFVVCPHRLVCTIHHSQLHAQLLSTRKYNLLCDLRVTLLRTV